jgi:hypothetical protein
MTYEAPSALLCGSRSLGCVCAVEENGYPLGIDSSVSLLVNASRGVLFATAAFPLLGFAVLSGVQCVAVALSVGVGASSLVVSRFYTSLACVCSRVCRVCDVVYILQRVDVMRLRR